MLTLATGLARIASKVSVCPKAAAIMIGVTPRNSLTLTSAPASISSLAATGLSLEREKMKCIHEYANEKGEGWIFGGRKGGERREKGREGEKERGREGEKEGGERKRGGREKKG